jgi:hypothetical protein
LTDADSISAAVEGQQIIISFLGPNSITVDSNLYATAYKTIFTAMRKHNVSRILALATVSVTAPTDSFALTSLLSVTAVWTVAHSAWKSMVNIGEAFSNEGDGLEWTVFRVGGLADGEESPEGDVLATVVGGAGYSATVRRADVARWVVRQCDGYEKRGEGKETEWAGQMPLLCSRGSTLFSWRPGFGRILGLTS